WGVALGKEIGAEVLNLMSDGPSSKSENMDASTNRLIESWRRTVR
ncbi:MAG: hypothetical protein ACJAUG_002156, partial [Halioglobus sp.]